VNIRYGNLKRWTTKTNETTASEISTSLLKVYRVPHDSIFYRTRNKRPKIDSTPAAQIPVGNLKEIPSKAHYFPRELLDPLIELLRIIHIKRCLRINAFIKSLFNQVKWLESYPSERLLALNKKSTGDICIRDFLQTFNIDYLYLEMVLCRFKSAYRAYFI